MKLRDLISGSEAERQEAEKAFQSKGYCLPAYDREALKEKTAANPSWIHFGAGNIFRAFPAADLQKVLNAGSYDRGIIVAESFDYEIIEKAYKEYDSMSLAVTLKGNGSIEKEVIGSVTEAIEANPKKPEEMKRLTDIFLSPSLQMVSFTITEKGYALPKDPASGAYAPYITADMAKNPAEVPLTLGSVMAQVSALVYQRFAKGLSPITLLSMDNCSHNGDKLKAAVVTFAEKWAEAGFVPADFVQAVKDETIVTFPLSMIDKITPRPDEKVAKMLEADGFEDTDLIITSRNTYTAPFVNAEETEYLVIEDRFAGGRPPLEEAGFLFTNRETVDRTEKMKVCTCLNPLHTAMSIFGCLLGYQTIHDEMEDPLIVKLVTRLGYVEGMPVVTDPGVIRPEAFLKAVLEERLPNPFMPDSPWRIITDTSQKIPIRFGETLKAYEDRGLNMDDLVVIPLAVAGYMRYLQGVGDKGESYTPSSDPMLEELTALVKAGDIDGFLSRKDLFAQDLNHTPLASRIKIMYDEMCGGEGSVRKTLEKYLA